MIRAALKRMGREDLIGNSKEHLIPEYTPRLERGRANSKQSNDFHHRIKVKAKPNNGKGKTGKKYSYKKPNKRNAKSNTKNGSKAQARRR
jgi:hypothetical protein